MDLKLLIEEINYQEKYTYEQRVDFFNKYHISQTQKFFNPIYELAKFIVGDRGPAKKYYINQNDPDQGFYNACYSHSGAVASSFNKTTDRSQTNKEASVRVTDDKIGIYAYMSSVQGGRILKPFLWFHDDKTISITDHCHGVKIKRDLYNLIDQWLIDFGYEKW